MKKFVEKQVGHLTNGPNRADYEEIPGGTVMSSKQANVCQYTLFTAKELAQFRKTSHYPPTYQTVLPDAYLDLRKGK